MSADDSASGGRSGNSFAAQHAVAPRHALKVAPTDGSTKFNTIRIPLIPVACWRLNDPAFAFDSSFVSPNFRGELVENHEPEGDPQSAQSASPASPVTNLAAIVRANPGCPAALFGHCDPAGGDGLNKTLGDRRAIAIYALLTRQPDLWAALYDDSQVGDTWDLHMVQTMLASIRDGQGQPYYAGSANGIQGADTTDAVKRFQGDAGLSADGDPGSKTRKALFGAYMDWLCTPDAPAADTNSNATTSNPPAKMSPTRLLMQASDFLGGTGGGQGDLPKMSLQSCGKFNPIVLLTSAEMGGEDTTDGASKTTRNADDAPNRRVIMFFFKKGTTVDPSVWPCPKVKEANDACKSAFWPDGDARRKNGAAKRLYEVTRDTMACRFYDRFARRSPCETGSLYLYVTAYPEPVCRAETCNALSIVDGDGNELFSIPAAQATMEASGALTWKLDLKKLPTPTTQLYLVGDTRQPIGAPFDPVRLQNALAANDLDTADGTFDPRPGTALGSGAS